MVPPEVKYTRIWQPTSQWQWNVYIHWRNLHPVALAFPPESWKDGVWGWNPLLTDLLNSDDLLYIEEADHLQDKEFPEYAEDYIKPYSRW